MKNKAILVHGWDGTPDSNWFPWLKERLKDAGFEVIAPQLPDADYPRIGKWVPALGKAAGEIDENTYFVAHSMGCQTVARLLEGLPEEKKAGGVIFVAGFFKKLTGMDDEIKEDPEVGDVADEWLKTPLDLAKVKSHIGKSVAIFSDNDPYVPIENQEDFRDKLNSEIIEKDSMGHFSENDGIRELPIVLEKVLEITK